MFVHSAFTADCIRTPYLGSPVNLIHKAHEQIFTMLQENNLQSHVYFFGSEETLTNQGENITDYYFRVDDGGTKYALLMRIIH